MSNEHLLSLVFEGRLEHYPPQQLSVDGHDYRARRHEYCAHGRRKKYAPRGEYTPSKWNSNDVVSCRMPSATANTAITVPLRSR